MAGLDRVRGSLPAVPVRDPRLYLAAAYGYVLVLVVVAVLDWPLASTALVAFGLALYAVYLSLVAARDEYEATVVEECATSRWRYGPRFFLVLLGFGLGGIVLAALVATPESAEPALLQVLAAVLPVDAVAGTVGDVESVHVSNVLAGLALALSMRTACRIDRWIWARTDEVIDHLDRDGAD